MKTLKQIHDEINTIIDSIPKQHRPFCRGEVAVYLNSTLKTTCLIRINTDPTETIITYVGREGLEKEKVYTVDEVPDDLRKIIESNSSRIGDCTLGELKHLVNIRKYHYFHAFIARLFDQICEEAISCRDVMDKHLTKDSFGRFSIPYSGVADESGWGVVIRAHKIPLTRIGMLHEALESHETLSDLCRRIGKVFDRTLKEYKMIKIDTTDDNHPVHTDISENGLQLWHTPLNDVVIPCGGEPPYDGQFACVISEYMRLVVDLRGPIAF